MRVSVFLLGLLALCYTTVHAQVGRCGADVKLSAQPAYQQQLDRDWQTTSLYRKTPTDSVIIPVHVIIVHPPGQAIGQGSNLSYERILSQIAATNKDFRRLNDNRDDTPAEFPVGDSQISFQLASIDPDGMPTDGVTRYATSDDFDQAEVDIKNTTRWPRDTYLNVWVAPTLDDLGFAYLPSVVSLPAASLDGCAVLTSTFGGPGFATFIPYNLGRTLTHEIGHYLGLRHIWDRDGCGSDDGIADTPRQDTSHFGCPIHPRPSCNNAGDMFMNYMDYTDDACMSAFTIGQIDYMWQILNGSRRSMLSAGDRAFEVTVPISVAITDQTSPPCYGGFGGSITVEGSGGAGNYRYRINGGSLQGNPTFRFLTAGSYVVEVVDNDGLTAVSDTIVLSQPPPIEIANIDTHPPRCHGDATGSIDLVITGAQGSAVLTVDTGVVDGLSVDSLAGGLIDLQIVDSAGCMLDTMLLLDSPAPIMPAISTSAVSCFGADDGSVSFDATGGRPPYQYGFDGLRYNEDVIYDGYAAGNYLAYVRDDNGCVVTDSFIITQPDDLLLGIQLFDGGVAAIPTGGSPPYRYQLNSGPIVSDSIFNGLAADMYDITLLDANDCRITTSVLLTGSLDVDVPEVTLFWPQPVNDRLMLAPQVTSITLYSISGATDPMIMSNDGSNVLSVDALPPGMYVVVIDQDGGGRTVDRLVILR